MRDADSALFDAYLDACLEGSAPSPDTFLARHPDAGDELRAKISSMYETMLAGATEAPPFERVGEYRLLQRLDAGGMGTVYLAEQESLGRVVALKIVRPELAGDPEADRRFAREARAAAPLRHPGIVTVFGAGVEDGTRYIAMELVPGRMLSDMLAEAATRDEPLAVERVVRWGARLARALDYAHGRGVVHRDVKPQNIRITPDDQPLLLDFGIALELGGEATAVTRSFHGSPAYAAPEQVRGVRVDGRADVYALAVTLYHALTGSVPFDAPTVEGVFHRVLNEPPTAPRKLTRAVSADLETVLLKALEKRPEDRYATAAELADEFEAVLSFRPVRARPPGPARRLMQWARRRPARAVALASAVAFAALLGLLAFLASAREERERLGEARSLLAKAEIAVEAYGRERLAADQREARLATHQLELHNRYFTDEEDHRFALLEREVEDGRRRRDELYHEVLSTLRRAERLDPELDGTDAVRAALYVEKWEEARTARDPRRQAFFRHLAERHDPDDRTVEHFARSGTLRVTLDPSDAICFAFAFPEQFEVTPEGGRRLVPVPVGEPSSPPVPYGTVVLRVVKGGGGLAPGDLVLEVEGQPVEGTLFVRGEDGAHRRLEAVDDHPIRGPGDLEDALQGEGPHRLRIDGREVRADDLATLGLTALTPRRVAEAGGVTARVHDGETTREVRLPAGTTLRPTAIPLFCKPEARVGAAPRRLPVGTYLLVARAPGHEERRAGVTIAYEEERAVHLELLPTGSIPVGFVHVPAWRDKPACLIMEREVTCAEYLAFLDDPEIQARVQDGVPALVPRSMHGEWAWAREGERFVLSGAWHPQVPVMGVSHDDALAYAAWRSARDGVRYALPTEQQWNCASGCWPFRRLYPFGEVFRPKWVSSNWARRRPRPEPSLRYPIDESPYGVYATSGSAMEWLDAWYDREQTRRWLAGGAWGYARPAFFLSPGGWGSDPSQTTGTYGFRLVRAP
jgi:hypothetical protein